MKILNSKGEPILLNQREQLVARNCQRLVNDLGYEIDITTLTTIMKRVTEQKFFEIAPADYLPVRVGEGAWSSNLVTYRSFNQADEFETGVVNTGSNNGRLAVADAGVDSLTIKVLNWAKSIGWTLMDLAQAAKAGNWDLVTAKEKSRKKNWDLGIQRVAFLGARGDSNCLGLLNQAGITTNLTVITQSIKSMTPAQLKAFLASLIDAYRSNNNRTAWPTHFIIPESDYLGLAAQASADFPVKSVLQLLEEALKTITRNANFKVLPLAYGDAAYSGLGVQRYTLLNYDEESIRMDIPVDYTNTLANSIDNFSFQNVGYGQFTGVLAYRPLELMYFQF
jgi:hypothetical protein